MWVPTAVLLEIQVFWDVTLRCSASHQTTHQTTEIQLECDKRM